MPLQGMDKDVAVTEPSASLSMLHHAGVGQTGRVPTLCPTSFS